jgi:SAM-dependent methyltransferase
MRDARRSSQGAFRVNATRVGSRRPRPDFEPTPRHIVTAMLELAGVRRNDVVYDLGSGDGRIPIAAARDFGASAVGVEIHAARIEEARRKAAETRVTRKVRFVNEDLFDAEIRPATVLTLFLLPEANLVLRPRLQRELAPGARVVSYIHDMGNWKPDTARYTLDRLGRYHRLYLWTIPPPAQRVSE